jgi:phosphatidylinositol glycan class O
MTDEGNHGGATKEETDSGLFVFSRRPFTLQEDTQWAAPPAAAGAALAPHTWVPLPRALQAAQPRMVQQVDLVPSLALLLGLPVPYSSLGGLIPELLASRPAGSNEHDTPLADAWLANCLQVMRYLRSYGHSEQVCPLALHVSMSSVP